MMRRLVFCLTLSFIGMLAILLTTAQAAAPIEVALVRDINPTTGAGSSPAVLTDVNGRLFFRADDGTHGIELWKSDGTVNGTVLVKDIYPG